MNEQIRAQLREFLAKEGEKRDRREPYVSQKALGKALGYQDGALLSTYLSGTCKGNIPDLEEKLANYFAFEDKKKAFAANPSKLKPVDRFAYAPTSISQKVYNAIEYCRMIKGITLLHGDTGIGKTMAAMKYIRDNRGFAICLTVEEGCRSRRDVFITIAEKLGVDKASAISARERSRLIKQSLNQADKVIIIDEAHRLPAKTLEYLRDLGDATMDDDGNIFKGAGIVLMGNSFVSDFIANLARKNMEQCRGRLVYEQRYAHRMTTLDDVRLVFPYLVENNMDAELKALLKISCDQSRGLRGAVLLYNNAVNDGGDVSLEGLARVCVRTNIGRI